MSIDIDPKLHPPRGEVLEPQDVERVPRTTLMTLLHALPAIAFVSLMIWSAIGVVGYLLGALINTEVTGLIIVAVILGPVAIWANRKIVILAMDAERYPDR